MSYRFPESTAVTKLLGDLIGAPLAMGETEDAVAIDRLSRPYACICLDDSGHPVGAMVADIGATVSLGGQLMMLPEASLTDQLRTKTPSEDVVSAMSEIFNNITTTLNHIEGNPHVRSTPAKPVASLIASSQGGWIPKASQRCDLSGDLVCGKGRLVLFWR
jgi:hypothetical protein